MNKFKQYQAFILKRRAVGASYAQIGLELGITSAEVRRIGNGKYPGEKVAKRLGIPVICFACHRRMPKPRVKKVKQSDWDYSI